MSIFWIFVISFICGIVSSIGFKIFADSVTEKSEDKRFIAWVLITLASIGIIVVQVIIFTSPLEKRLKTLEETIQSIQKDETVQSIQNEKEETLYL